MVKQLCMSDEKDDSDVQEYICDLYRFYVTQ